MRNTSLRSLTSLVTIVAPITVTLAQSPPDPRPNFTPFLSDRATVIYANSDGDNSPNENIYFKVWRPGTGENWLNSDWFYRSTAWLDPATFHFARVSLKMYGNPILLNKGGYIGFNTDQVKETSAGKIGTDLFTPGLNIVGGNAIAGSTAQADRRLTVFAEGGSIFNGPIGITQSGASQMTLPKKLDNGADLSNYKLFVLGGILAKEIRVNTGNWADYVFAPTYRLKPLGEVEQSIQALGHLPGMPSAKDIEANGFSVGEIARLQQEKIEELTLYVIRLQKEIDQLKAKSTGQK